MSKKPKELTSAVPSYASVRFTFLLLAAAFLALDLVTPRGVAVEVLYVAVVLVSWWLPRERDTWIAATGCSLLVVLGYSLSPPGVSTAPALINRAVALFAIWVTAFLLVHRKTPEKKFQLAVEGSPNAILMSDPQGRIALANSAAEQLFGYGRRELLGQPVEMLVPERLRENHSRFRASFAEAPSARPMGASRDLYALHKEGREIPVEIGLNPIATEKGWIVLSTIIDITERKRAEEAIAARNKELQILLHVISHDLREPLRSIENFSLLVHDRYRDRLDEKGRDFLRRVVNASARMRSLLNDILELSRARQTEISTLPIDGASIVEEALRLLRARIEESNASVRVAERLPSVRADRVWATAALYNLISNALKFVRDGEPPHIEIDGYRDRSGDLRSGLVVRDRGPGVPREDAERIFELFQRGVGREVEGTGAGLAIVRTVAERQGGRAWVRPREGGGSEFIVTFGED